jgi:hypothetical protein
MISVAVKQQDSAGCCAAADLERSKVSAHELLMQVACACCRSYLSTNLTGIYLNQD